MKRLQIVNFALLAILTFQVSKLLIELLVAMVLNPIATQLGIRPIHRVIEWIEYSGSLPLSVGLAALAFLPAWKFLEQKNEKFHKIMFICLVVIFMQPIRLHMSQTVIPVY